MKKIILFATTTWLSFLLVSAVGWSSEPALGVGRPLPEVRLAFPQAESDRTYLGITGSSGTIGVGQIQAELVIIEIYSMYCPFCQKEAPRVNQLYELIRKDAGLSKKIKIIGIGVGNSAYEVDYFRKNYKVPFPLFPDEQFAIHKQCGEIRTPYFITVRPGPDRSLITHLQPGGFESADSFLKQVLASAGIK